MSIDLAAIRARCEAATPGPWAAEIAADDVWSQWIFAAAVKNHIFAGDTDDDIAFLIHARTDIPLLLAEIERLRAENRRLDFDAPNYCEEPNCTNVADHVDVRWRFWCDEHRPVALVGPEASLAAGR